MRVGADEHNDWMRLHVSAVGVWSCCMARCSEALADSDESSRMDMPSEMIELFTDVTSR